MPFQPDAGYVTGLMYQSHILRLQLCIDRFRPCRANEQVHYTLLIPLIKENPSRNNGQSQWNRPTVPHNVFVSENSQYFFLILL